MECAVPGLFRRSAPVGGDDGRRGLVVAATEQREVEAVAARQGLEGAAVLSFDASAHGELRVDGAVRGNPRGRADRAVSGGGAAAGRRLEGAGYAGAR